MSEIDKQLAEMLKATAERAVSTELGRALRGATPGERGGAGMADTLAAYLKPLAIAAAAPASAETTRAQGAGGGFGGAILGAMPLSPVLRGLFSLFGGGGEEETPAPLPRYAAPSPVRVNAGLRGSSGAPVAVDYGQDGESRGGSSAAPQVVVNVSAMDTQSFLDRSDDIARAVKRALLESHSLNDVIAEL